VITSLALFASGLLLCGFFSGAETGFYRMTRLRLVLEAKTGDWIARVMLWLSNQPSLFVATTLVGTNLASYLTSLSVVIATHHYFPGRGAWAEVLLSIAVSPILFIGGELVPKNLFFNAPNRLIRRCAPLLVACVVLFAPLTVLLWLFSAALRLLTREAPQEVRLSLARRELEEMLVEGHEAGILRPVQRSLAQTMLAVAGQPVRNFAAPAGRVVRVTTTMTRSDMLRIAQRHRRTLLPLEDAHNKRQLVGFIRTIDLFLGGPEKELRPEPLVELAENETFLSALGKLSVGQDALGHVVGEAGRTVGFLTGRDLRQAMLRAQ
jgi:putative hemolysin